MEIKSFYVSPMAKLLIVGTLVVAGIQHRYIGEKISQARTFIAEKTNTVKDPDGFNETSFSTREAEVAYIREYVKYMIVTKNIKNVDESKKVLIPMFEIFSIPKIEEIMSEVVRLDLTISQVKEKMKGLEKKPQAKLDESANNVSVKQPVTKSYVKKTKPRVELYNNEDGKMKPLSEIIKECRRQTAMYISDRPYEISTKGSFYVINKLKSFKGYFNVDTGIIKTIDETGVEIFKVTSWVYFSKEDDVDDLTYIYSDYQYTKSRKENELYGIADELTNNSKSEIARIMGVSPEDVKYDEYWGD